MFLRVSEQSAKLLSAEFAQVEVSHQAEAMICGHNDYIPRPRQAAILIARTALSRGEATAMAVKHDGPLAAVSRGLQMLRNRQS